MNDLSQIVVDWSEVPGAAHLKEIYGYWPTFHDASVREINADFEQRAMVIVVDYTDEVDSGATEVHSVSSQITLRWFGISSSTLRITENLIYGIKLFESGRLIRTHFEDYEWGLDGEILSDGVELIGIEPVPEVSHMLATESHPYSFKMGFR